MLHCRSVAVVSLRSGELFTASDGLIRISLSVYGARHLAKKAILCNGHTNRRIFWSCNQCMRTSLLFHQRSSAIFPFPAPGTAPRLAISELYYVPRRLGSMRVGCLLFMPGRRQGRRHFEEERWSSGGSLRLVNLSYSVKMSSRTQPLRLFLRRGLARHMHRTATEGTEDSLHARYGSRPPVSCRLLRSRIAVLLPPVSQATTHNGH